MNQHSTPTLLAWRANVDLQPVLDKKAAIQYVSKYASKPEVLSQSYREALSDFCSRVPHDLPAEKAVSRLFARMAADRDISAQEAVHLLLGDQLVGCSRVFVNLNAYVDAPHLLKETLGLDEDDCVFENAFFACYEKRPIELELLNAVEFCRRFDVKKSLFFCAVLQCCQLCSRRNTYRLMRLRCTRRRTPSPPQNRHCARVAARDHCATS